MCVKNIKCYIYTRVSTAMQVDAFSLNAQREKLRQYANYHNIKNIMTGKSGDILIDFGNGNYSVNGFNYKLTTLNSTEATNYLY